MNNVAINIDVHVSVDIIYIYLGYIFRMGVARSDSNSEFNFLRNCQAILQSSYIILHSYQQYMSVPISLYLCQHLLLNRAVLADMSSISLWF